MESIMCRNRDLVWLTEDTHVAYKADIRSFVSLDQIPLP